MSRLRIFVSSVQKEFATERRAIRSFVQSDALLSRFFDVFLFEDVPASNRRADEVYLTEVDGCDVYLGLFGNDYGFEDAAGVSPTEREIVRPVPFYRIFKGHLFEQVDTALDFVLSKLDRSVGTRAESVQAPVRQEVPPDVVREAIVNAIAHRDYASDAAVQVSVFADRVEVWNPGELVTTVWRDWLTEQKLAACSLTERQRAAIAHLKKTGSITSSDYQKLTGAPPRSTTRDLEDLVKKGLLEKLGTVGRGARYVPYGKPAIDQPNRPTATGAESAINRPNRPAPAKPRRAAGTTRRKGKVK